MALPDPSAPVTTYPTAHTRRWVRVLFWVSALEAGGLALSLLLLTRSQDRGPFQGELQPAEAVVVIGANISAVLALAAVVLTFLAWWEIARPGMFPPDVSDERRARRLRAFALVYGVAYAANPMAKWAHGPAIYPEFPLWLDAGLTYAVRAISIAATLGFAVLAARFLHRAFDRAPDAQAARVSGVLSRVAGFVYAVAFVGFALRIITQLTPQVPFVHTAVQLTQLVTYVGHFLVVACFAFLYRRFVRLHTPADSGQLAPAA